MHVGDDKGKNATDGFSPSRKQRWSWMSTQSWYLLSFLAASCRAALPALYWPLEVCPVASPTTVPWQALTARKAAAKQKKYHYQKKNRHFAVCFHWTPGCMKRSHTVDISHFYLLCDDVLYFQIMHVGKSMSYSPLTWTLQPMFLFVSLNIWL